MVGSKSLDGVVPIYSSSTILLQWSHKEFFDVTVLNGGEEGVGTMAAEGALSRGVNYEPVYLEECRVGCSTGRKYYFEQSYEPRRRKIAEEVSKIYRIYGEDAVRRCAFGDELGKEVIRIPVGCAFDCALAPEMPGQGQSINRVKNF